MAVEFTSLYSINKGQELVIREVQDGVVGGRSKVNLVIVDFDLKLAVQSNRRTGLDLISDLIPALGADRDDWEWLTVVID